MLDHKISGTFWSAPGPSKPFLRTYCPYGEGRLKSLAFFTSLEERWLQGRCEICTVQCMVVANPLPEGSLWRLLWGVQNLPAVSPWKGYIAPYTGRWQTCVLRLDRIAVCWTMLGGFEEHIGIVTGPEKLSCPVGSRVFCLWSSQAKLLCKCTISVGALTLQADSSFILYSSMPISTVSHLPLGIFLWYLSFSLLVSSDISFLPHQVLCVLCAGFCNCVLTMSTVSEVGFVKLSFL